MQNVQAASSGLRATLSEMGYPKKMISLAFKDAKIHTLDHILELLISKEAEYNEILAEQKPLKVVPPNDNVELNPNKRKNSSKQEEKQRNRENKNTNKSEKKEKANENIQSKEKDQEFGSDDDDENKVNDDDDEEDEVPKYMDTESLNYTQSMIQALKRIRSAKDSTWFIVELSDQLKSLQFETNDGATKVRYYLDVPRQYPRIEEYKKAVYLIIVKVLNSKVSKKYRMNFEDLETVLTLAFELRILRARQMENVISLYPKLCARHMYKPNEEMITKLEKIYQEVKSKQKDDHEEVLPEEELEEEKEEEKPEEPTGPTGEGVVEAEAEVFIPTRDQEKEYCIICVQRFREIVFMPCCHFLTCLLCSSKIGKCPVCNNKVHKHLQIFWS